MNPYAPVVIFRPRYKSAPITGYVISVDKSVGKIRVQVRDTVYTIRAQHVELIQY